MPAEVALNEIRASFGGLTDVQHDLVSAVLEDLGQPVAQFQVDATARILNALSSDASSATVIAAGTGAGKTLAFYLPALAELVARRTKSSRATQVIAIYPRNELLKDQLAEVLRRTSAIRSFLQERTLRPISVGVLFGQTPHDMRSAEQHFKWPRSGADDLVCPFLKCPACGGELRWHRGTDGINAQLHCACGHTTTPDEVLLTRGAMSASPPDILLTSAEMMNRVLSNTGLRHVLGVGPKAQRQPRLLLMDEAHLYGGTTGAQTAFVLRRWRHQSGDSAHIVGLSATLEEPEAFFSSLTGVAQSGVVCVQPRNSEDEMYDSGAEYLLALRGNPMSETALLSTTIQSLMLLRRILDRNGDGPSHGLFGSKAFAFADNLDVANRLHADLSGAEGRTVWDRPLPNRPPLAALRRRNDSDADVDDRSDDGQIWDLPAAIDPQFDRSRSVELVSSQSSSANPSAEIVVATASLEVGIDDPHVGAVLQHKASRSGAAFIQRRGRAGRSQRMRPLTALVLSDYGRDRLAYQGYEQLFNPRLRPTSLPTSNRHLQKLQASAVLLDFLASRLEAESLEGDLWRDLRGPEDQPETPWGTKTIRVQRECAKILESLVSDPIATADLELFLQRSLQLDVSAARMILWAPPRALLTTAVPALLRRIEGNWSAPGRPTGRDEVRGNPLPENMTTRLYDDLMVPEVVVHRAGVDEALGEIPVRVAMQEFAPGRVSKRFTPRSRDRLWVPIDPDQHVIDVSTFLTDWDDLGLFQVGAGAASRDLRCLRPIAGVLQRAAQNVPSSNNSQLVWRVQHLFDGGTTLDLPSGTRWDDLIERITVHTHSGRSEMELRRFATGTRADHPKERNASVDVTFVHGDGDSPEEVAVGFAYNADAISVELNRPDPWPLDETLSVAVRGAWFRHLVHTTDQLPTTVNHFARDWLATLYIATITAIAARQECDGRAARAILEERGVSRTLRQTVAIIFKAADPHELGTADADGPNHSRGPTAGASSSPGAQRMTSLLRDESVCACIHDLAECLSADVNDVGSNLTPTSEYLTLVLATTVGSALREAFQRLCPSIDTDALTLDVVMPATDGSGSVMVWLTEEAVGGAGLIEEMSARAADDPRVLLRLVEAALGPTDHERVDTALRTVASRASDDPELHEAIATARSATAPQARRHGVLGVLNELQRFGVDAGHAIATAVAARVVRAGATHSLDEILQQIVEKWIDVEHRLGFEADPRALAYALRDDFAGELEAAVGAPGADMGPEWRFSQIYSLLWPAGADARAAGLNTYSPYVSLPRSERLLVNAVLHDRLTPIDVGTPDWRPQIEERLRVEGDAQLREHSLTDRRRLRQAILAMMEQPVDLDLLLAHPRVTGARIDDSGVEVNFDLAEIA